jgi:hypothetical protein
MPLSFAVDTNFIGDESEGAVGLRRLYEQGRVVLCKTDTADTELSHAPETKRQRLLDESSTYAEQKGSMVWGHSALGPCALRQRGGRRAHRPDLRDAVAWPHSSRSIESEQESAAGCDAHRDNDRIRPRRLRHERAQAVAMP